MRQRLSEQHLQSAAHHECPPRMAMPFRPLPPLQHARTHTHTQSVSSETKVARYLIDLSALTLLCCGVDGPGEFGVGLSSFGSNHDVGTISGSFQSYGLPDSSTRSSDEERAAS